MNEQKRPVHNGRKTTLGKYTLPVLMMLLASLVVFAGCAETPSNDDSVQTPPSSQQDIDSNTPSDSTQPPETPDKKDELTTSQKNAVAAAQNYIGIGAFSYNSLIEQLEFDQYSHEDAVFAADNCDADWNAEAAEAAKAYLEIMPMSRGELIDQLKFDGFTEDQASYGAEQNGY